MAVSSCLPFSALIVATLLTLAGDNAGAQIILRHPALTGSSEVNVHVRYWYVS